MRESSLTELVLGPDTEAATAVAAEWRALRSAQTIQSLDLEARAIDLPALAAALVERLAAVAPAAHPVSATGSRLVIADPQDGDEAVDLGSVLASAEGDAVTRLVEE